MRTQKYRLMTLVSGGIRFMTIFAEVPRFFGQFRDLASVIIWRYAVRRRLFSDLKTYDLE